MILAVSDSSYIVEAILKDSSVLEDRILCAPDYAVYEVLNAIWKHDVLLNNIKDSKVIVDVFFDLISSQRLRFVTLQEKTIRKAYDISVRAKTPVYDVAFVVLAKEMGVELKTLDKRQEAMFRNS